MASTNAGGDRFQCRSNPDARKPSTATVRQREAIQCGRGRSTFVTIALIILGFLALVVAIIAVRDLTQRQHAVTRNFPVIGHFRYFFEEMGQPLRQYLFAGDLDERPYNRVTRSWVYASAKGQNNFDWIRIPG